MRRCFPSPRSGEGGGAGMPCLWRDDDTSDARSATCTTAFTNIYNNVFAIHVSKYKNTCRQNTNCVATHTDCIVSISIFMFICLNYILFCRME